MGGGKERGISLALGGGGARGFAHVGVIKVFSEAGIGIEEITGSSMGAIVGAYYAFHQDIGGLEAFSRSLDRTRMLSYIDPLMPRYALMKGEKLKRLLTEWFGDARIEEARIPLAIIATTLHDGKEAVLREGRVVDALMASAAIPGILPAVLIGGIYYVDGGVNHDLPLAGYRLRSTVRVAVSLTAEGDGRPLTHQPSIADIFISLYQTHAGHTRQETKRLMRGGLVLSLTAPINEALSFHKSAEYLRAGETAAQEALPQLKRLLER